MGAMAVRVATCTSVVNTDRWDGGLGKNESEIRPEKENQESRARVDIYRPGRPSSLV